MAISTVVFDAYGTLFDVTAAARAASAEPGFEQLNRTWESLATAWRRKQLEYTWLRTLSGAHCDFWQVTGDALDWALDAQGIEDPALRERLMQLYRTLDAYGEVPAMLAALKSAGLNTAILSNGAPGMLSDAIDSAGIAPYLDHVLSVESVGVFKPDPKVYDLIGKTFGCPRGQVLFVSSNGWDAACATDYGLRSLWVNRTAQPIDRLPATPDLIRPDLSDVPQIARDLLRDLSSSGATIGETRYFHSDDGLRLAYRDDGRRDAPVLLCLAGLTRNLADFDYVARDFADRARVLRLDTRGRGQSDWDRDYRNYNLTREAADALALLDHLGIDKAAILGTSRGGLLAMLLAGAHKSRLSGVCLVDIGPEIEPEGLAYIAQYLGARPTATNYEEAAEQLQHSTAAKFPGVPLARWRQHAERLYCSGPERLDLRYDAQLRRAILEHSATDSFQDVWALFRNLDGLPLGLIHGANSDILSTTTAKEMCQRHPGTIYGEVPDRGHVPFLDEPEAKEVIVRFLDALPQACEAEARQSVRRHSQPNNA